MKILCIAAIFVALSFSAKAQDVIVKKDGSSIQAKIIEVTKDEIKYKSFDNQEGPSFVIPSNVVDVVKFENGTNAQLSNNQVLQPKLNTTTPVQSGMKYGQLKNIYKPKNYIPSGDDRYSPGLCGVTSFLIPGVGQMICGETGRGLWDFFGSLSSLTVARVMLQAYADEAYDSKDASLAFGSLVFSSLALWMDIHSIVNAVKMAKIKDMYNQDLKSLNSVKVTFAPVVAPVKFGNDAKPYVGISAHIVF